MIKNSKSSFISRRFTIIELLGVIVIAMILMFVSIGSMKSNSTSFNARTVGSYIRLAQANAVAENRYVAAIVQLNSQGNYEVGAYSWYQDEAERSATWLDYESDHLRRLALLANTKITRLSGQPKLFPIPSANTPLVFLFSDKGVPDIVDGIVSLKFDDEETGGEMVVSINRFSGKINYGD